MDMIYNREFMWSIYKETGSCVKVGVAYYDSGRLNILDDIYWKCALSVHQQEDVHAHTQRHLRMLIIPSEGTS